MKVLLQTDDLLTEPSTMDEPVSAGGRARQLIHMAIGLHDVYALQASASHLVQCRHRIEAGLRYAGPALFSVFSGATGVNDLPPYLVAAAAMESRAFPAFTYDPSAGGGLGIPILARREPASRRRLAGATPSRTKTRRTRHATEDLAFTLVDFIACDPRHGRHFATVPRRCLERPSRAGGRRRGAPQPAGTVPSILMVDATNRLHKAVVGETGHA